MGRRERSEHNDNWALKRANLLRSQLGWEVNIPLGDLPLEQLDELFSTLFARVTKMDGTIYPGASLMNMLNAFNPMIRRASEIRSVKGDRSSLVDKEFTINSHPMFAKTYMVMKTTLTKGGKQGANKKRKKVRPIKVKGVAYNSFFPSIAVGLL